ncbi:hypothetical protein [Burkholderia multivorans]|uniref:Gp38 n=1 Tax=Burkholderia multivorans CGD2 TaxID=513052 RepID=B9BHQ5_9BURK|nr:hypothetical protein [Burkholderia multivorans]EEE09238.1 gp38 [Burkholderia multivorans CGD2]EEE15156.1 gp38 [Burkholderia multivorans CGD2M]
MIEIKNGGPAFPGKASINRSTGELQAHQFGNNDFETLGMTLRDYFAGQALIATFLNGFAGLNEGDRAALCYRMADAMLREREVSQ